MTGFDSAYVAWSNAPFPTGSDRDDLADLHGDLHLIEEWVLSTVYPFAEHGTVVPVLVDIPGGIADLRERIGALRPKLSGADLDLATAYLAYLDLLDAAYNAFRVATSSR